MHRLSRQAQEQLQARTKKRLKEAGLTEQSRAINKARRGKALRLAEAKCTGQQLSPEDFTRYMSEQKNRHTPVNPRDFKVENRKFRRRMKRAILSMKRNKAVGVDNVHSKML